MKKTTCYLLALVGLLITLNGYAQLNCVPEQEFDYGNLKAAKSQYSFDAADFIKSDTNFDNHFKYKNETDTLHRIDATISIDELKKKFAAIQQMNYNPGNGDIAAMVMHFGMDGDKIFVIFQLTVMHSNDVANQYTWELAGNYYMIEDNKFKEISTIDFFKYTNAYLSPNSDIYIIHTTESFGHKFYHSSQKFYGDVKYCTMPFQQIFKMYNDNDTTGSCANPNGNGLIKFSIEATRYRRSKGNCKLHVVASYGSLPEDNDRDTFRGLGADFSQMSPPNNAFLVLPPFKGGNGSRKTLVKKMK